MSNRKSINIKLLPEVAVLAEKLPTQSDRLSSVVTKAIRKAAKTLPAAKLPRRKPRSRAEAFAAVKAIIRAFPGRLRGRLTLSSQRSGVQRAASRSSLFECRNLPVLLQVSPALPSFPIALYCFAAVTGRAPVKR
jgi:hypothetical protein